MPRSYCPTTYPTNYYPACCPTPTPPAPPPVVPVPPLIQVGDLKVITFPICVNVNTGEGLQINNYIKAGQSVNNQIGLSNALGNDNNVTLSGNAIEDSKLADNSSAIDGSNSGVITEVATEVATDLNSPPVAAAKSGLETAIKSVISKALDSSSGGDAQPAHLGAGESSTEIISSITRAISSAVDKAMQQ